MILRRLSRLALPPATVFDAGCGDGSLALQLMRSGYRVAGVDVSPESVLRTRTKLQELMSGVEVQIENAELVAIPFADSVFDVAVAGEVLEHVEDDANAARELFRVLKPGGILLVTVPAGPGNWGMDDEWAGHVRRYSRESLRGLLEGAGFDTLELSFWGFPVALIYNSLIFRPWLKRKISREGPDFKPTESAVGGRLASSLVYLAFSLDKLFFWVPAGLGLIGVFRKK